MNQIQSNSVRQLNSSGSTKLRTLTTPKQEETKLYPNLKDLTTKSAIVNPKPIQVHELYSTGKLESMKPKAPTPLPQRQIIKTVEPVIPKVSFDDEADFFSSQNDTHYASASTFSLKAQLEQQEQLMSDAYDTEFLETNLPKKVQNEKIKVTFDEDLFSAKDDVQSRTLQEDIHGFDDIGTIEQGLSDIKAVDKTPVLEPIKPNVTTSFRVNIKDSLNAVIPKEEIDIAGSDSSSSSSSSDDDDDDQQQESSKPKKKLEVKGESQPALSFRSSVQRKKVDELKDCIDINENNFKPIFRYKSIINPDNVFVVEQFNVTQNDKAMAKLIVDCPHAFIGGVSYDSPDTPSYIYYRYNKTFDDSAFLEGLSSYFLN